MRVPRRAPEDHLVTPRIALKRMKNVDSPFDPLNSISSRGRVQKVGNRRKRTNISTQSSSHFPISSRSSPTATSSSNEKALKLAHEQRESKNRQAISFFPRPPPELHAGGTGGRPARSSAQRLRNSSLDPPAPRNLRACTLRLFKSSHGRPTMNLPRLRNPRKARRLLGPDRKESKLESCWWYEVDMTSFCGEQ